MSDQPKPEFPTVSDLPENANAVYHVRQDGSIEVFYSLTALSAQFTPVMLGATSHALVTLDPADKSYALGIVDMMKAISESNKALQMEFNLARS